MPEQIKKTPEEIKQARILGMAKAREAKAAKNAAKAIDTYVDPKSNDLPESERIQTKTVYFDDEYHDYNNFVEGLKLAMKNLDVRSKNDVVKCIPVAEEFVRVCQTKYPS